jgi:isopenicillin-N N-acyltransferase like protein
MIIFDVSGDHYRLGQQHARHAAGLKAHILQAVDQRLDLLEKLPVDVQPFQAELEDLWEVEDRSIVAFLRGLADGLDLEWSRFFRYTIASYLFDRAQEPIPGQGCTAWAASGVASRQNLPILAKNRDYRPGHRRLQRLVRTSPQEGYRYINLTSAGSPGVFSSGMNEKGLAVADTHVVSTDTGPGMARYSVMMQVLELCSRVPEAVEHLQSVKHIGDGTLTLVDAEGNSAVFEAGHSRSGVIAPQQGYVVATNHYTSPGLSERWLDLSPLNQKGNTHSRYAAVAQALQNGSGGVDFEWGRRLMASHTTPLEAICRHPQYEPGSVTISTVFFLSQTRTVLAAGGMPCRAAFKQYQV